MSNVPTRSRRGTLPFPREEFRRRLFECAGISEQDLAELLKKAIRVSEAGLEAVKTELVTYKGQYTPVDIVDHHARLRAAEGVFDLVGACPQSQ